MILASLAWARIWPALLRNADLAMYHAKGRGKNGWQTYVPELGETLLRRMSVEKALESAVEKISPIPSITEQN